MPIAEIVICLYRVCKGSERKFVKLLERHWLTLRRFALVTAARPQHFRGVEQDGRPIFVEIFAWKNAKAAQIAHEHPEVMVIWEAMDKLCEVRGGRPNMEFPHVQPLKIRVQA